MKRSLGAAVVLAMLLAALAATVAVTLFAEQQRWSRTVEHRRDAVQTQALALAGIQWARQIVRDNAKPHQTDLTEPWALALPPIPLENGELHGVIVDAQGRLNVNALGEEGSTRDAERARIARLFALRGGPAAALDAIADWIDRDRDPRKGGAEDAYYAAQSPPAIAANAPILRVGELAAVKGVTPAFLNAVASFLVALPPAARLNVNTAPPEVLEAVVENLPRDGSAAILAERAQKPFSTVAEFRARLPRGATVSGLDSLTVQSDYFLVTIAARQGATVSRARALLRRGSGPSAVAPAPWPTVVWQVVE